MEFQIPPHISHLFADALAAFMRGHADRVWLNEQSHMWNELWVSFRDADGATVAVSFEAAATMFRVWGSPRWWRDQQTFEDVTAHLRPQWRAQMRQHARAHIAPRAEA
ncbi:hypothetical protein ACWDUX_30410 [Streptomyces sp. NPDC003444]